MMRSLLLLTVLSFGFVACDEADPMDTTPDSERIVSIWNASTASLNVIVPVVGGTVPVPVSNIGASADQQTFTFRADNQFTFLFEPQEGRQITFEAAGQAVSFPIRRVSLAGTYSLNETTGKITFSTLPNTTDDDFRLGYDLNGSTLDLEAENSDTIVRLFGLADESAGELAGLVRGGTITYQSGS